MSGEAIVIRGLKKKYQLGLIGGRTLQAELESRWARFRGKEDPNVRMGTDVSSFGQSFYALDGIDLTIRQGETVGIIGANGAGKSTLLKILSRVTAPTEGEIDIYGRVTSMLEVGTGFHREMTGRQNIYMNGTILGMSRREIDEVLPDIIAFSEIGEFLDTPVKRYSSGMYVKLAFAVAAHLKSEIMILDEVLAVGDMAFQNKCLTRMREAADREGRTILYVSHNMNTIRRLCDRAVVLDKGRLIFDGPADHAIAIYMEHALGENRVDMDLTGVSVTGISEDVNMTRLRLPDRVMPVYESGEELRMQLSVSAKRTCEKVSFRLTLRTDSDSVLGTAWSEEFTLPEGERELLFSMPLRDVAKGIFYGTFGLYESGELGRKRVLCLAERALRIELPGVPVWNTEKYGYLRLPGIRRED